MAMAALIAFVVFSLASASLVAGSSLNGVQVVQLTSREDDGLAASVEESPGRAKAASVGESQGRRGGGAFGGAFLSTTGSFTLSSNRGGNSEAMLQKIREESATTELEESDRAAASDVPSGYECGSSSSRGGPPDWTYRRGGNPTGQCGKSGQTLIAAGKTCALDPTCVAFNFDTQGNTPCWKDHKASGPDNSGDLNRRWIQCASTNKTKWQLGLQWTRGFSSANVGVTIPVELNKSAPSTQFKSCTPQSSVTVGTDKADGPNCLFLTEEANGHSLNEWFVRCPTINGCVTCPASHPYPSQHFIGSQPAGHAQPAGDKKTVCKTYASITAARPVDVVCTPSGELGENYDPSGPLSCIRVQKSAKYLTGLGSDHDYVVRCMIVKHVMCTAQDANGKRACASTKEIMLDRIEKCPEDAKCGDKAEVSYTGLSDETLPFVITKFVRDGGSLCAGVASTG